MPVFVLPLLFFPHFSTVRANEVATAMTADRHGYSYVASYFYPSSSTHLTKIDADGHVVYSVRPVDGWRNTERLMADDAGNLYATLSEAIRGPEVADPDPLIIKLDSNGAELYRYPLTVKSRLVGASIDVGGMTAGPEGDLYLTGYGHLIGQPASNTIHLNPQGHVLYSVEVGGSAITSDSRGDVYIAGITDDPGFPTTPGAYQTQCGCQAGISVNAYLVKLNPDGSMAYSTFILDEVAPSSTSIQFHVSVDEQGRASVASVQYQRQPDNPLTAMISRISADGSSLLSHASSTLAGVPANHLEFDGTDRLLFTGPATDTLPITTGAFPNGGTSAGVMSLTDGQIQYVGRFPFATGNDSYYTPDAAIEPDGSGGFFLLETYINVGIATSQSWQISRFVVDANAHPTVLSVTNPAQGNQSPGVAPGELIRIAGVNLGPTQTRQAQVDSNSQLPFSLGGTEVYFNGIRGALVSVSDTEVAALVPFEIANASEVVTEVRVNGANGSTISLPLLASEAQVIGSVYDGPDLNWRGTFMAAALNEDGSVNSEQNPADSGSIVSLFINGGGMLSPASADGSLQTAGPTATIPITATYTSGEWFGGPAPVTYAGAAPGLLAGVMQVNLRLGTVVYDDMYGTGITLTFGGGVNGWPSTAANIWVR